VDLTTLGILILLLPLTGAVLAGAFGARLLKGRTHYVVILGVAAASVCAFLLFDKVRHLDSTEFDHTYPVYEWISNGAATQEGDAGNSWFKVDFCIDPLTAVMLVMVTFIATLIIIYSRDYMRHDGHPERGYERFFAYMGLFVFSMCALVLSGNFLLLYLGWEAVGLCSYLLIGFYYQRPLAAAAAKKAFLVNRIGDFGFGLGILLIYLTFNTLNYEDVFRMITAGETAAGGTLSGGTSTAIALLLFCGAIGKSAQLPLYVWLPDAMEGPSPVSALIHAATMVTAGVYMVARCGAIFAQSEVAMMVVAVVGGVTALFAATMALAQYDMKRILAYSTISQLGYMFLGVGVYAADAAIFHLFTHAFFKALLFLGAGSVMHAMGGVIDIREFGGLRKILPWTWITFLIGAAALAGLPFLSGFYSKDAIIYHALSVVPWLGYIGVITAALTAFYTFRMVFLAFCGEQRVPNGVHAHESGRWILGPLCVLAVGAAGVGAFFHLEAFSLTHFVEPVFAPFGDGLESLPRELSHAWSHGAVGWMSGVIAVLGIGLAFFLYVLVPELPPALRAASGRLFTILHNKYYVDEGYDRTVVQPLWKLGRFCFGVDRFFVDGLVWFVSAVPRFLGFVFRGLQQGALQGYAVVMVGGFGVLLFLVLLYSRVQAVN